MFRKPKKIQRRVFCADNDEDEDPEPPPPPIISLESLDKKEKREKKENKPVKSVALLSFGDDDDDCEEFKVKKSSQSKRLAKRRDKERKKVPDGDSNKFDNNGHEENSNNTEKNAKPRKKVTLEGLILSGREAMAADGSGDVSEEEGERGFHTYRAESVRAALAGAGGPIPDAALIHAARKTRQQARELGDFVPINQPEPTAGSRLVREGDDSGDDDEDRIQVRGLEMPSDKPQRGATAMDPEEEDNSGGEEWADQQMQKAMPAIVDITGEGAIELNPFAVAPPPPRLPMAPHLRPLAATSADQLVAALTERLDELQLERINTNNKREALLQQILNLARVRESRAARRGDLDAAYRRAQAIRGYLTDLIECLDEKMPLLESLEGRALALHKRRHDFLVERRRADVRDQAQDVLALAARAGSSRRAEDADKVRRAAEREGRRRARRLRRAALPSARAHRDGDSSDDDLPPPDHHHHLNERESIRSESAQLFADALAAWRGARGVCARLGAWRARAGPVYQDAHLPAALPKLLAPYVRHQLILWNPLADDDNEDYEKMDWYKCLMMYGTRSSPSGDSSESETEAAVEPEPLSERGVRDDPDLMLVPTILNKVVLPKITELVEVAFDPMCVRACVRLRSVLIRCGSIPGCARPLRQLAAAVATQLSAALHNDVFLPTLPPPIMEGPGGAFWRRCVGAGVRLLRGALALTAPPPLLRNDEHVLALIEALSMALGAAPGGSMAWAGAALAESLPRAGRLRARALQRLARLATLALSRLHSDNPLHMKAIEQARAVLAEAKAAE